jgi:hypothetical protein
MNVKDIRRENLRILSRQVGGITALAHHLKKTQGQISHVIGKNPLKNIGDRFASQIEHYFNKPHGWLDRLHPEITHKGDNPFTLAIPHNEPTYWLPIITVNQIDQFLNSTKSIFATPVKTVPTQMKVSKKSFAINCEELNPKNNFGLTLPKDSILIIDSKATPTPNSSILAGLKDNDSYIIYIFSNDAELKKYHSSTTENAADVTVLGVIKQLLVTL